MRISLSNEGGILSLLIGSAPDCLWLLSGIFLLRWLWFKDTKAMKIYIVLFYILAASHEIGQYFGIIPGTFDIADLLSMTGTAFMEGIIYHFLVKRRLFRHEENT